MLIMAMIAHITHIISSIITIVTVVHGIIICGIIMHIIRPKERTNLAWGPKPGLT